MQAVTGNVDYTAKTIVLAHVTPSNACHIDYDWACIWLLNPAQPS